MKNLVILFIIIFSNQSFALSKRHLTLSPERVHGDQLIKRKYYQLSYSNTHEQAEWVFYRLTAKMLKGTVDRADNFLDDPLVINKSATTSDYTNTGFDRGHLIPAADMKISLQAMQDTFYMSNISPQRPKFNRVIWKKLETKVREYAQLKESIYIITGPVLEKGLALMKNGISIPESFFKIIIAKTNRGYETIAYLIPNQETKKELSEFVVSIDELEEKTQIDFLKALPDQLESRIEANQINGQW